MSQIKNLEGMSSDQLNQELAKGGKFVVYQYAISIIVMTFRRSSDIYFIKAGESSIKDGLGFSALSFVLGWWGIPWGPIYTIGALVANFGGGKDVTTDVIAALNAQQGG